MSEDMTDEERHEFASDGARQVMKVRTSLIRAIPDEADAFFVVIAGLSLFMEVAEEYADDQEEFTRLVNHAKEIAEFGINHRAQADVRATRH